MAVPVILTTPEEVETWLMAPWVDAGLLTAAADRALTVVVRGRKEDSWRMSSPTSDAFLQTLRPLFSRSLASVASDQPTLDDESRWAVVRA